jgi:nitrate/TMAO reductase-like tetraheme cytochrome c subunit
VKAQYGQVVLVDNGGFFPETDSQRDLAWFLMDVMRVLSTDAVGLGERDLRFGASYLRAQLKRTRLPMVCANLIDKRTRKPLFAAYFIKQTGNVRVGIFGLLSDKADLGPSKDSLRVEEPTAVARQVVAELRKKGADVVVLLAQLGKVESEDLVSAVDGIDALIVGHDAPMIPKGRMIKNTVACYGGEQGQYVCRTQLTLDAKRRATTGEAETVMLGPEIGDKPEVLRLVKSFEDGFNEKQRKAEMERATKQQVKAAESSSDRYLGADLCIRCHQNEGEQWKTTSHSVAWETLVQAKKEAAPECISCHVVGFNQPGGFASAAGTPQLGNVQCENCHGMGTRHDAFVKTPQKITEATCKQCHSGEQDPGFSFEKKLPLIVHSNTSGETLKQHRLKMERGAPSTMKGSAH